MNLIDFLLGRIIISVLYHEAPTVVVACTVGPHIVVVRRHSRIANDPTLTVGRAPISSCSPLLSWAHWTIKSGKKRTCA